MKGTTPQAVTALLQAWSRGDQDAAEKVLLVVYGELRRLAARHLRRERRGHSLQPTALVHEAYVRLAAHPGADWPSRAHFFAAAAQIMRHILVDHARRRVAAKRGGPACRVSLADLGAIAPGSPVDLEVLELDDALRELAVLDADQGRLVELRFFGGLTMEETAALLGVSESTAKRDWRTARAWLHRRLTHGRASAER